MFMDSPTPVRVANVNNVLDLALGSGHGCAIDGSGSIRCWGAAYANGSSAADSARAMGVGGLGDSIRIAAGADHSCAVDNAQVWCWGRNDSGQLGVDNGGGPEVTPQLVDVGGSTSVVGAGGLNTCSISSTGQIHCWGVNGASEVLGLPSTTDDSPLPVVITGTAIDVAVGAGFACVRRADRSVWCWGAGTYGQLGNGGFATSPEPVMTFPPCDP
jgi:alpha-tubulin suppressor-like RCC1 family protein